LSERVYGVRVSVETVAARGFMSGKPDAVVAEQLSQFVDNRRDHVRNCNRNRFTTRSGAAG